MLAAQAKFNAPAQPSAEVQNLLELLRKQYTAANFRQYSLTNSAKFTIKHSAKYGQSNLCKKIYYRCLKNMNELIYMLQRGDESGTVQPDVCEPACCCSAKHPVTNAGTNFCTTSRTLNFQHQKEMVNVQLVSQLQSSLKDLKILSNGMINSGDISILLQKNGKEALTKTYNE